MNKLKLVTWKKENQIVEHRRRDDWWRKKNTFETRDTYQDNAETQSTMNTEQRRVWYNMYEELDHRRTLDPWLIGELGELRVRKADDEWLKGELEELAERRNGTWDQDWEGAKSRENTDKSQYKKVELLKEEKQPLRVQKLSKRARKRARAEEREAAPEIVPRRYRKPFYEQTQSEDESSRCRSEIDSDEECS